MAAEFDGYLGVYGRGVNDEIYESSSPDGASWPPGFTRFAQGAVFQSP